MKILIKFLSLLFKKVRHSELDSETIKNRNFLLNLSAYQLFSFSAKKAIAIFVTVSFLISSVCHDVVSIAAMPAVEAPAYKQIFSDFILPYDYGKITKSHFAGTDRVLINIQDLHCHPQVQRNISNIIKMFDDKFGVTNVYLEGAYGDVSTKWLAANTGTNNKKKELLNKILDTGKLTGAEYYSATSGKTELIKGLEKKEPYIDNLKRFGSLIEKQPEIQVILKGIEESTQKVKKQYYTKRQYKIEDLSKEYISGDMRPEKYYALLLKHTEKLGIDLTKYENNFLYIQLLALQKQLNYKAITSQLQTLVSILKEKLPYNAYKMLLSNTKNFEQTDKLYAYIIKLSKDYGLNVSTEFNELNKYFNYIELSQKINPLELLKEEERLTREINTRFSDTVAQREVVFLTHFERYLRDYLSTKITSDDYEYYKENINTYKRLYNKYVDDKVLSLLKPYMEEVDKFYAINMNRNDYFTENIFNGIETKQIGSIKEERNETNKIIENMQEVKRVDVIVTGGFHSQTVTDILQKHGVSYIVITPNVQGGVKEAEKTYYEIAKQQKEINFQTIATMIASLNPEQQKFLLNNNSNLNFKPGSSKEEIQKTLENSEFIKKLANKVKLEKKRESDYPDIEKIAEQIAKEFNEDKDKLLEYMIKVTAKEEDAVNFFYILNFFSSKSELSSETKQATKEIVLNPYLNAFLKEAEDNGYKIEYNEQRGLHYKENNKSLKVFEEEQQPEKQTKLSIMASTKKYFGNKGWDKEKETSLKNKIYNAVVYLDKNAHLWENVFFVPVLLIGTSLLPITPIMAIAFSVISFFFSHIIAKWIEISFGSDESLLKYAVNLSLPTIILTSFYLIPFVAVSVLFPFTPLAVISTAFSITSYASLTASVFVSGTVGTEFHKFWNNEKNRETIEKFINFINKLLGTNLEYEPLSIYETIGSFVKKIFKKDEDQEELQEVTEEETLDQEETTEEIQEESLGKPIENQITEEDIENKINVKELKELSLTDEHVPKKMMDSLLIDDKTVILKISEDIDYKTIRDNLIDNLSKKIKSMLEENYDVKHSVDFFLIEAIKNAFVHGNKLDTKKPIYIYVETNDEDELVFNVVNEVYKENYNEKEYKQKFKDAKTARLHGRHNGENFLREFGGRLGYVAKEEFEFFPHQDKGKYTITSFQIKGDSVKKAIEEINKRKIEKETAKQIEKEKEETKQQTSKTLQNIFGENSAILRTPIEVDGEEITLEELYVEAEKEAEEIKKIFEEIEKLIEEYKDLENEVKRLKIEKERLDVDVREKEFEYNNKKSEFDNKKEEIRDFNDKYNIKIYKTTNKGFEIKDEYSVKSEYWQKLNETKYLRHFAMLESQEKNLLIPNEKSDNNLTVPTFEMFDYLEKLHLDFKYDGMTLQDAIKYLFDDNTKIDDRIKAHKVIRKYILKEVEYIKIEEGSFVLNQETVDNLEVKEQNFKEAIKQIKSLSKIYAIYTWNSTDKKVIEDLESENKKYALHNWIHHCDAHCPLTIGNEIRIKSPEVGEGRYFLGDFNFNGITAYPNSKYAIKFCSLNLVEISKIIGYLNAVNIPNDGKKKYVQIEKDPNPNDPNNYPYDNFCLFFTGDKALIHLGYIKKNSGDVDENNKLTKSEKIDDDNNNSIEDIKDFLEKKTSSSNIKLQINEDKLRILKPIFDITDNWIKKVKNENIKTFFKAAQEEVIFRLPIMFGTWIAASAGFWFVVPAILAVFAAVQIDFFNLHDNNTTRQKIARLAGTIVLSIPYVLVMVCPALLPVAPLLATGVSILIHFIWNAVVEEKYRMDISSSEEKITTEEDTKQKVTDEHIEKRIKDTKKVSLGEENIDKNKKKAEEILYSLFVDNKTIKFEIKGNDIEAISNGFWAFFIFGVMSKLASLEDNKGDYYGISFFLHETVKNAFVHGNKLDISKPIYVYIDKNEDKITLNVVNEVYKKNDNKNYNEEEYNKKLEDTDTAGLHGRHIAIEAMLEDEPGFIPYDTDEYKNIEKYTITSLKLPGNTANKIISKMKEERNKEQAKQLEIINKLKAVIAKPVLEEIAVGPILWSGLCFAFGGPFLALPAYMIVRSIGFPLAHSLIDYINGDSKDEILGKLLVRFGANYPLTMLYVALGPAYPIAGYVVTTVGHMVYNAIAKKHNLPLLNLISYSQQRLVLQKEKEIIKYLENFPALKSNFEERVKEKLGPDKKYNLSANDFIIMCLKEAYLQTIEDLELKKGYVDGFNETTLSNLDLKKQLKFYVSIFNIISYPYTDEQIAKEIIENIVAFYKILKPSSEDSPELKDTKEQLIVNSYEKTAIALGDKSHAIGKLIRVDDFIIDSMEEFLKSLEGKSEYKIFYEACEKYKNLKLEERKKATSEEFIVSDLAEPHWRKLEEVQEIIKDFFFGSRIDIVGKDRKKEEDKKTIDNVIYYDEQDNSFYWKDIDGKDRYLHVTYKGEDEKELAKERDFKERKYERQKLLEHIGHNITIYYKLSEEQQEQTEQPQQLTMTWLDNALTRVGLGVQKEDNWKQSLRNRIINWIENPIIVFGVFLGKNSWIIKQFIKHHEKRENIFLEMLFVVGETSGIGMGFSIRNLLNLISYYINNKEELANRHVFINSLSNATDLKMTYLSNFSADLAGKLTDETFEQIKELKNSKQVWLDYSEYGEENVRKLNDELKGENIKAALLGIEEGKTKYRGGLLFGEINGKQIRLLYDNKNNKFVIYSNSGLTSEEVDLIKSNFNKANEIDDIINEQNAKLSMFKDKFVTSIFVDEEKKLTTDYIAEELRNKSVYNEQTGRMNNALDKSNSNNRGNKLEREILTETNYGKDINEIQLTIEEIESLSNNNLKNIIEHGIEIVVVIKNESEIENVKNLFKESNTTAENKIYFSGIKYEGGINQNIINQVFEIATKDNIRETKVIIKPTAVTADLINENENCIWELKTDKGEIQISEKEISKVNGKFRILVDENTTKEQIEPLSNSISGFVVQNSEQKEKLKDLLSGMLGRLKNFVSLSTLMTAFELSNKVVSMEDKVINSEEDFGEISLTTDKAKIVYKLLEKSVNEVAKDELEECLVFSNKANKLIEKLIDEGKYEESYGAIKGFAQLAVENVVLDELTKFSENKKESKEKMRKKIRISKNRTARKKFLLRGVMTLALGYEIKELIENTNFEEKTIAEAVLSEGAKILNEKGQQELIEWEDKLPPLSEIEEYKDAIVEEFKLLFPVIEDRLQIIEIDSESLGAFAIRNYNAILSAA